MRRTTPFDELFLWAVCAGCCSGALVVDGPAVAAIAGVAAAMAAAAAVDAGRREGGAP